MPVNEMLLGLAGKAKPFVGPGETANGVPRPIAPSEKSVKCEEQVNNHRIQEMFEQLAQSDHLRSNWNGSGANYTPQPIILDAMDIPEATRPLVDVVAKNMHRSWIAQRKRLGWVHGARVDDQAKMHPEMVSFEKLPDMVRGAHKKDAAETIKLMVCAGCTINQISEGETVEHTKVPNALMRLLELIAYHLHEMWCKGKVEKGYVHGMKRDEKKKTHPDILPYYLLEIENRYFDQNSAEASIMHILNSGCSISPPKYRGSGLYDMDYTESVYYNELQRQIKTIRHNLAHEFKLKQEWAKADDHTYVPKPLDLDAVRVPQEVVYLIDLCAKSMHDSWIETNQRQGWTYGKETNHDKKQNPAMVPYHALSEELQRADQVSAEQTLRSILACGYIITTGRPKSSQPKDQTAGRASIESDGMARRLSGFIARKVSGYPEKEERKSSWYVPTKATRRTGSPLKVIQEQPPSPMDTRDRKATSLQLLEPVATPRRKSVVQTIPPELQELIDVIAHHLHETWSRGKIAQGYTYAAARNNERKHHPNLVPYHILSTSDRAFDVGIAEEAIMCVLKTGCKITKPARILVGDLISDAHHLKWAVSDQVSRQQLI
jgi:ryanodine receptor 2